MGRLDRGAIRASVDGRWLEEIRRETEALIRYTKEAPLIRREQNRVNAQTSAYRIRHALSRISAPADQGISSRETPHGEAAPDASQVGMDDAATIYAETRQIREELGSWPPDEVSGGE